LSKSGKIGISFCIGFIFQFSSLALSIVARSCTFAKIASSFFEVSKKIEAAQIILAIIVIVVTIVIQKRYLISKKVPMRFKRSLKIGRALFLS
jgi:hypothetical protein